MSPKVAKAAAPAKEDKKKRAPSPYILFCAEKRAGIKADNPTASFGETGKLLGQMWAKLDDAAKAAYAATPANKKQQQQQQEAPPTPVAVVVAADKKKRTKKAAAGGEQ